MTTVFKSIKVAILCCAILSLGACIRMEPRVTAPHINLSPDVVFTQGQNDNSQALDFGLQVGANESDSLANLEVLPGVRVRSITANGAAAAAELKAGDVILSVNDVDTNHPDTFASLLQGVDVGTPVQIKVRRDTTVFDTSLQGRARVQADINERYRVDPIMSRAGYRTDTVQQNNQVLTGARVMEIFPNSTLPQADIAQGDIIVAVNEGAVESAQGLVNQLMAMDYGAKVNVSVINRDGRLQERNLRLWDPGKRISRFSLWPLFTYETDLDPSSTRFSLLDLWIVSLFKYHREENERSYRLFTVFEFGTGAGELVEESETSQ